MKFFHSGDMGDAIAALPSIRALGGGELLFGDHYNPNSRRETMRGQRYDSIKPLLETQPYITQVGWTEQLNGVTHDFSTFRHSYVWHENLALAQARHIRVAISLKPWLNVPLVHKTGRVVIARSSRYHNPIFPWRRIREKYADAIFIGLPHEHQAFESSYGEIEYQPTKDLLEAAYLIAGSKLLICNQTCACWIAFGLGTPIIQETMARDQNSVIERSNCKYTRTAKETQELIDSL